MVDLLSQKTEEEHRDLQQEALQQTAQRQPGKCIWPSPARSLGTGAHHGLEETRRASR